MSECICNFDGVHPVPDPQCRASDHRFVKKSRRVGDEVFMECDACRAKSGMPVLCAGCLHNRETIRRLRKRSMAVVLIGAKAKALIEYIKEIEELLGV